MTSNKDTQHVYSSTRQPFNGAIQDEYTSPETLIRTVAENTEIGPELQVLTEVMGVTLKKFAELYGCSPSTMSKMIRRPKLTEKQKARVIEVAKTWRKTN